jgi:integrase
VSHKPTLSRVRDEAANAIRALVKLRTDQPDRGILDRDLGRPVRYLFLRNGSLAGADYLFADPLARICGELAILNGEGKPRSTAHRFRHALGTQLAEKGARVQTIMKVLGHKSPGMSMTYTHISDPTVVADYQAVLQPGASSTARSPRPCAPAGSTKTRWTGSMPPSTSWTSSSAANRSRRSTSPPPT